MQHVITLTARPGTLEESSVDAAAEALIMVGAFLSDPVELAPGTAVDIPIEHAELPLALNAARNDLTEHTVDVNGQPAMSRRKSLLIADMDSTIIVGESLDELADHAGLRDEISAITARAMRGELDFEEALEERVAKLAGLSLTAMDAVIDGIKITDGAKELIATMSANGAYCALVSGGFKPVTAAVRKRLGFHEDRANTLETAGEALTGRVIHPILGQDAKIQALTEISEARGINLSETMAVGDGANDLGMLTKAGTGIAFHAKPIVRDAAPFRIDHCDLTALLYLQGYRDDQIVHE